MDNLSFSDHSSVLMSTKQERHLLRRRHLVLQGIRTYTALVIAWQRWENSLISRDTRTETARIIDNKLFRAKRTLADLRFQKREIGQRLVKIRRQATKSVLRVPPVNLK